MPEQRFPAGPEPRIRIANISGDLKITAGDGDAFLVHTDDDLPERMRAITREGDTLVINGCDDDLELEVPALTVAQIEDINGDVAIEGVRRAEIARVSGDVELEGLAEGARVSFIDGDLRAADMSLLEAQGQLNGDVELEDVGQAELSVIHGDLHAEEIRALTVGTVSGEIHIDGLLERLQAGSIGGDLHIEDNAPDAELRLGSVGGDLHLSGGAHTLQSSQVGGDLHVDDGTVDILHLSNVGGDLSAEAVGELKAANIGGDLTVRTAARDLEVGNVSGDAQISRAAGSVTIGNIGGNLKLQSSFPPGGSSRLMVGGDAVVQLPAEPSLSIQAVVGGEVRGAGGFSGDVYKQISLSYGAGEASLSLQVGGDLRLTGGGRPEGASTRNSFGAEFGRDMDDFGREMGELGRELGNLGRELAAEISAALGKEGAGWAEAAARKLEEKARRMQERVEEKARKVEEQARQAGEGARLKVKINEREWQLDPERLERIKEQARRAASEGLSGAIEAVERALGRIGVPSPPTPPTPPDPPAPPAPPTPPDPPAPATGQTIRIEIDRQVTTALAAVEPPPAAPRDIEQERETILRMIAEGRVSPEEGDLLLEALGK